MEMDKGGVGDQKSILIVLHGDFKINNDINAGVGHDNNANTGDSNIGVEEDANQITELCWEVFDPQNKKSLTGVQSINQEEQSTLSSIQNYINDIQKDACTSISFLVTDKRLYNYIKCLEDIKWVQSYEFFDILAQGEVVFAERKNNLNELIDYFSFQKESSSTKSDTFQTAQVISKIVLIVLRTTIPFTNPLNESLLKSPEAKTIQAQIKSGQQGDQDQAFSEIQNQVATQSPQSHQQNLSQSNDEPLDNQNESNVNTINQQQLDKEEVWGDQSDQKDSKVNDLNGRSNASSFSNQTSNGNHNIYGGLGQLISSINEETNDKDATALQDQKKKSSKKGKDNSRSRSRSHKGSSSKDSNSKSDRSSSSSSSSGSSSEGNDEADRKAHEERRVKKGEFYYLRLRGLPFNARERELQDFLGFSLNSEQITFKHDNDGRFCGESVIRTRDKKQLDRIQNMHMKNMGKRYIEIFPAERSDFIRAQDSQNIEDAKGNNSYSNTSNYDSDYLSNIGIVKIRGLPYNASDTDIYEFFSDSKIISNGIQKVYDGRRPSGEAFILFETKQDASKAIEKDKQRMGSRYIEIFLSHPKEYTTHIKKRKSYQGNGHSSGSSSQNRFSNNGHGGSGRFDKYGGNGGGFSSHHSNHRGNEGRYGGYNSRYSNSPHRSNGSSGQGYYKKMGGNNYDRNSKMQDNPRYGGNNNNNNNNINNNNDDGNKFSNKPNFYHNNNNNNQNQQMNHNNHNRNNNYQNDFNRNRYKGKEDSGKYGGNHYQGGNNQYDNQYGQQSQSQSQHAHQNNNQQGGNWQSYQNKNGFSQDQQGAAQQYGRQDYYQNQPATQNQQASSYLQETAPQLPLSVEVQQNQSQYYPNAQNPTNQYQAYQGQVTAYAQQQGGYDTTHHQSQHQQYQYGQPTQNSNPQQQSYSHHSYYGLGVNSTDQPSLGNNYAQQIAQTAAIQQQGSVPPIANVSHQYYQPPHSYDASQIPVTQDVYQNVAYGKQQVRQPYQATYPPN